MTVTPKPEAGQWLILRYIPVSLFSLRMTHATSKGGKTLLVPTPYAMKMTLIDACFRVFGEDKAGSRAREVFDWIKKCEIRFSPPEDCIVQNTFIKIRQEEREGPAGLYASTIAYREFCFFNTSGSDVGGLKVAINISGLEDKAVDILKLLARHINCIGKRGSFWQYSGDESVSGDLPDGFTRPFEKRQGEVGYDWMQHLDDFGEALCKARDGFDRISTYGSGNIKLGEHRILIPSFIPYRFERASRHFTQYKKTVGS